MEYLIKIIIIKKKINLLSNIKNKISVQKSKQSKEKAIFYQIYRH